MGKQTSNEIRQNLLDQLEWQSAERDDKQVAELLHKGEKADGVHTLDEAGLLDEFFAFLNESGVMEFWKGYEIQQLQRVFLPTIYFLLLYGSRVLFGIESMNALPVLLFSNVAVMTLLGFNARLVKEGMTKRGSAQRTGERPYQLMDPQTLAGTICKSSSQELEQLFNGTISYLAKVGVFLGEIMVAIDGTKIITTEKFEGCGCLAVEKSQQTRSGAKVQVIEFLFGWRLIAIIDLTTLIPVAIKIVQIQCHESPYLIELVKQAQRNLAPYSRLVTLVADRAYLDGADLYELDQMQIRFVVIAKKNMVAYGTALCRTIESDLRYERTETVLHGQGRDQETELLHTQVQVALDIRTWDSYRPPPVQGKRLLIADRPALNAVVVRIWQNKPLKHPRIYLTNQPIVDPWLIIDLYDDRSWIENGLFRNTKQFWTMTRWFPQKTAAGVQTHLTFVMLMTATATAFRLWSKAQALDAIDDNHSPTRLFSFQKIQHPDPSGPGLVEPDPTPQISSTHLAVSPAEEHPPLAFSHHFLNGIGPARWRMDLQLLNRDKLIVFFGNIFGIFDIPVFLTLTGVPFHLPPGFGSHDDILAQFGILQE